MSFPRTVVEVGIKILRHHDKQYEVPVRCVQWGGVLKRFDEMGRAIFDEDVAMADEVCNLAWPKETRETSGFANAWPVVLAGGEGGGGGGGNDNSPGAQAGASFSGVRSNFSQGSAGINNFGGVRQDFSSGSARAGASFQDPVRQPDANSSNYGFGPGGVGTNEEAGGGGEPGGRPGGGAPGAGGGGAVATPGRAPKSHCGSMSGKHQMLPILNDDWEADDRFKGLDVSMPENMPKLPKGAYGIAIAGTMEHEQKNLFFPTDPRLYAVNKAGDPRMGSMVYDLDDKFRVDKDRGAPLQSAFRVVKKPLGNPNVIAVQLGQSGCTDTEGGYVYDVGQGGKQAGAVDTQVEAELPYVIAMLSVNKGGFIDVGSSDDKHEKGEDADGTKINKAHISTKALFRRNRSEDGPIEFDGPYPKPDPLPNKVRAFLGWDDATQMWRFWAEAPQHYVPTGFTLDPFKPRPLESFPKLNLENVPLGVASGGLIGQQPGIANTPNPATSGGPTGRPSVATPATVSTSTGTTPGATPFTGELPGVEVDPNRETFIPTGGGIPTSFGTNEEVGALQINGYSTMASMAGQAFMSSQLPFASGMALAQAASWGTAGMSTGKGNATSPVSGVMSAFGAQGGQTAPAGCAGGATFAGAEGDPWVYTQRPGEGRFLPGTSDGGWIIHPPETNPADQADYGMVPPNRSISSTYLITAPNAYFGAGTPALATGGLNSGWSWGMDTSTGDTIWRTHVDGTPTTGIRFVLASQNIAWYSGTVYSGTLDHANTANRTWSFPDLTANVELYQLYAGNPSGALTGVQGTLAFDTTNLQMYVNTDSGTGWAVLTGSTSTNTTFITNVFTEGGGETGTAEGTTEVVQKKVSTSLTTGDVTLTASLDDVVGLSADFTLAEEGEVTVFVNGTFERTGAVFMFPHLGVTLNGLEYQLGDMRILNGGGGDTTDTLSIAGSVTVTLPAGDYTAQARASHGGADCLLRANNSAPIQAPTITVFYPVTVVSGITSINLPDSFNTLLMSQFITMDPAPFSPMARQLMAPNPKRVQLIDAGLGMPVILTGPQDIDVDSDVTFNGLTLATPLPYTSGGTGLATLGAAGEVLKVNAEGTGLEYGMGGGGGMVIGDVVTSGTEGSVLFVGPAGVLAQNNASFFWDDTNYRLQLRQGAAVNGHDLTYRFTGDGLVNDGHASVLNAGWYRIIGPASTDFLDFTKYRFGHTISFRNADFTLEFHAYNGSGYSSVFAMYTAVNGNSAQVRNLADSDGFHLTFDTTAPILTTEVIDGVDIGTVGNNHYYRFTSTQFQIQSASSIAFEATTVGGTVDFTLSRISSTLASFGGGAALQLAIYDSSGVAVGKGGELLLQHINGSAARTTYASIKGSAVSGGAGVEVGDLLLRAMRSGTVTTGATLKGAGAFQIGTATDAVAIGDMSSGLTGVARMFYDQSVAFLVLYNSSNAISTQISQGTNETVFNEDGADRDFRIEGDSITHFFFMDATATTENIALLAAAAPNWQTMDRGLFIGDTTNAPTGNPASGHFYYSSSGQPTWRDDGGVVYSFTQATGGQDVTNSVTDTASTAGTIPDIADGLVYANDYVNLRNALFQLARMLKQDHDQLRDLGFLT